MELIYKSALVAEINRLIAELVEKGEGTMFEQGRISAFEDAKLILNTIEVKEVDLDEEIEKCLKQYHMIAVGKEEFEPIAKHFYELGLKAKDWEKERMEECPYRQVGCTMYEGKILECRGACSWVVDYPKLKELKAKKVEEV